MFISQHWKDRRFTLLYLPKFAHEFENWCSSFCLSKLRAPTLRGGGLFTAPVVLAFTEPVVLSNRQRFLELNKHSSRNLRISGAVGTASTLKHLQVSCNRAK